MRKFEVTNQLIKTEDYIFKITSRYPGGQWVKYVVRWLTSRWVELFMGLLALFFDLCILLNQMRRYYIHNLLYSQEISKRWSKWLKDLRSQGVILSNGIYQISSGVFRLSKSGYWYMIKPTTCHCSSFSCAYTISLIFTTINGLFKWENPSDFLILFVCCYLVGHWCHELIKFFVLIISGTKDMYMCFISLIL